MLKQFNESFSSRLFPSFARNVSNSLTSRSHLEQRGAFKSINELASKLTSLFYFISISLCVSRNDVTVLLLSDKKISLVVKTKLYASLLPQTLIIQRFVFPEKKEEGKKRIIALNCPTQYLHTRILSRPYGANDNLFCLDPAAIASPHCREKHCLGATPTSHDTRRLCFVVPWNWLPSCSPDTFSFTRISRMFARCKSALPPRVFAERVAVNPAIFASV